MSNSTKARLSKLGEPSSLPDSVAGCLLLLAWSGGGFAVVLILWITIFRGDSWTLTIKDALYWTAVLGMIAARYIDVAHFGARTIQADPATQRQVLRYAVTLLGVSALAWVAAQAYSL